MSATGRSEARSIVAYTAVALGLEWPRKSPTVLSAHPSSTSRCAGRMTKCMGAQALTGDAEAVRAAADDHPYGAARQRPERSLQRQEQGPHRSRIRAYLEKIVHQRVADGGGQRERVGSAGLGTENAQHVPIPVDVLDAQSANFTGSEPAGGKDRQNRTVANVYRGRTLCRGKQPLDFVAIEPLGNRSVGIGPAAA